MVPVKLTEVFGINKKQNKKKAVYRLVKDSCLSVGWKMCEAEQRHYFLWLNAMLHSHFMRQARFLKQILRLCLFFTVKDYFGWLFEAFQKQQAVEPHQGQHSCIQLNPLAWLTSFSVQGLQANWLTYVYLQYKSTKIVHWIYNVNSEVGEHVQWKLNQIKLTINT